MSKARLRSSKNISTEKLADLSDFVGNRIISAAREQIFQLSCLLDGNEEKYAKVKENSNEIIRLQSEFCDYCNIIANRNEVKLKRLHLKSALLDIKQNIAAYAERKNVGIDISLKSPEDIVTVDAMKLYYSIFHILRNSMENSYDGSKIRISVSNTNKYSKIKISDIGKGMDIETLEHCSEPFFSKNGGLGLGITIAKSNIEAMGGSFDIKSEEGKGTSVTMSILRANDPNEENAAEVKDMFDDRESIDEMVRTIFSSLI